MPLIDFELRDARTIPFEIVTAYELGYKIRQGYRNGRSPMVSEKAFSGLPVDSARVAAEIAKKTAKAKKAKTVDGHFHGHLLVYQNIAGGAVELRQLKALCAEAESVWASVWLISGVPSWGGIALLLNGYGFAFPEMKWVSYVNAPKGNGYGGFDLYLQEPHFLI